MFGWKELGAVWPSEQVYRILELLKQNRIRCRMPADEMYFFSPFHLPRPDRRWTIEVRRRDVKRAMALLAREGLARPTGESPARAGQATRTVAREAAKPASRRSAPAATAIQP